MDSLITKLYKAPKTVLTSKDLALLWGETNKTRLKDKIAYYVKQGALKRLTRGVFAKSDAYDTKELATSLYTPSYVSFETVLREAGMIFQHYDTVFVAGPWTKTVRVGKDSMSFRKLKDAVLFNAAGVVNKGSYSIATPERAFLDMIYLFPEYFFDNLSSLDWEKCFTLVSIYGNKQLVKRLTSYQKKYAQS
jgi:predicted transcriptional regulator of viral defense system